MAEIDVRGIWDTVQVELVRYAPRVLAAVLVLAGFWFGFRLLRPVLHKVLRRARFQEVLIGLLVDGVLRWSVYVLGAVMALDQLGVNVTAALAGIGVAGIALGFAAQDTVANMIAGFLIFWDKPFLVHDWVTVGEQYGQVREITLRSTRIRTNQNTYVVIPNQKIIDDVLVNHSKEGELRVEVPVGIAYKESIGAAREAILGAVRGIERVLADPAPDVVVIACGSSSVDLLVRVWIAEARDERPVFFATMERTKVALDEAGIEIPFPHLQLFLEDVREQVWEQVRGLRARGEAG